MWQHLHSRSDCLFPCTSSYLATFAATVSRRHNLKFLSQFTHVIHSPEHIQSALRLSSRPLPAPYVETNLQLLIFDRLYYTQFIGHPFFRPVIRGCSNFSGIGLIDTDPYIPQGYVQSSIHIFSFFYKLQRIDSDYLIEMAPNGK